MRNRAWRMVVIAGFLGTSGPLLSADHQLATVRPGGATRPASHQQPEQHRHDQTTPDQDAAVALEQTADQHAGDDTTKPLTPIPPITDVDRAGAFPVLEADPVRPRVTSFVLFDQLEWQAMESASGLNWNAKAWIGGDRNRLWFRSEGGTTDERLDAAQAELFYGRTVTRWWELVVGVRQDVRPGPAQTWAAFGLQGLAPYWFEVEVTGYVSEGGQTASRLETEYELLLTQRLVLQPRAEINLYGQRSEAHGIGAGFSEADIGVRVRFEFRREFAPYVGVAWNNTFGETKEFAEAAGRSDGGARVVAGLRLWY